MKGFLTIACALTCLFGSARSGSAVGAEDKAHTPEAGSAERKTLVDAVRAEYGKEDPAKPPVTFNVPYLKIHGDWAWIRIEPQSKDGKQHFEPQSGLFQRKSGKWVFVDWEPTEEGTDTAGYFKALKAKHPGLPGDIFPK